MLGEAERLFLEHNHSAVMITIARSGFPRPVRVGVALVEDKLWSSGIQSRVRTPRLRRDPRCSLFVYEQAGYAWLALDTTVSILEGPDAPAQNLRLFRVMQNRPTGPLAWYGEELDEPAFLARMVEEQRLIYEFEVDRHYGYPPST